MCKVRTSFNVSKEMTMPLQIAHLQLLLLYNHNTVDNIQVILLFLLSEAAVKITWCKQKQYVRSKLILETSGFFLRRSSPRSLTPTTLHCVGEHNGSSASNFFWRFSYHPNFFPILVSIHKDT